MRPRTLLLTALCCGSASIASAQITVIDQLPPVVEFATSGLSDSNCTFGDPNRAAARAEDFVVTQAVLVDRIEFQGDYPVAAAPSDPETFVIRFHADAAGLPGAVMAQPTATITQTLLLGLNTSIYGFVATFPPVALAPGTYWVEIFEDDSTTPNCFSWHSGVQDVAASAEGSAVDLFAAPGVTWTIQSGFPDQDNFALRVQGAPGGGPQPQPEVPALSSVAMTLFGVALAAFGMARLRSRPG
jgi:hypothetical protein